MKSQMSNFDMWNITIMVLSSITILIIQKVSFHLEWQEIIKVTDSAEEYYLQQIIHANII